VILYGETLSKLNRVTFDVAPFNEEIPLLRRLECDHQVSGQIVRGAVTKDVTSYTIVAGNPAKKSGHASADLRYILSYYFFPERHEIVSVMKSFRHSLNSRLIAAVRNIPFPSWKDIHDWPPIEAGTKGLTLLFVIRRKDFQMALWSAYSWMSHLSYKPLLRVVVDGETSKGHEDLLHRLFPGAEYHAAKDWLKHNSGADLGYDGFVARHPFGRKLACVFQAQSMGDTLYSDADILVFQCPSDVEQVFQTRNYRYLEEAYDNTHDASMASRIPFPVNRRFNAGLLVLPAQTFIQEELQTIQSFFREWSPGSSDWTTDQTLLGALLTAKGATPLSFERYQNNDRGFYLWERNTNLGNAVLRHYVGPVRHRFIFEGIPCLKQSLDGPRLELKVR
jgi:hypothetical protein